MFQWAGHEMMVFWSSSHCLDEVVLHLAFTSTSSVTNINLVPSKTSSSITHPGACNVTVQPFSSSFLSSSTMIGGDKLMGLR
jgi:hypothetical protein